MISVRVSFRYEFIPVPICSSVFVYIIPVRSVVPVRVIPVRVHSGSRTGTGMKFDHVLYWYHVKKVRNFVLVRDEWPS